MIKLGFNDRYRTLHLSNEMGKSIIGGVATHVDEQYRHHTPDTGFLHYRNELDFAVSDYADSKDIAIVTKDDANKLCDLNFDILVVHFFELINLVTVQLLERRKLVYILHSIPTPEPTPPAHPFGGHFDVEEKVKTLCQWAAAIVTVSHAEQSKLARIFPEFASKVTTIHNGITMPERIPVAPPHNTLRLGFIARMDYRKGLLETLKAIRNLDIELHIACDVAEKRYVRVLTEYIEASGIGPKLRWHGFCVGPRKEAFMKAVDAVIMPSLYEPFCYVAIEPLVYGKPVIVAANGGPAEIVGPKYRYQYDPYDPPALEGILRQFMADPAETVIAETEHLMDRMPMFDGKEMVGKYQALLGTL